MCSWAYGMTLVYGSVQDQEWDSMILVGLLNPAYSVIQWFWWIINTNFYMARIGCGVSQPRRLHQRIWSIYIPIRAGKQRSLLIAKGKARRRPKGIEPHTYSWLCQTSSCSTELAEGWPAQKGAAIHQQPCQWWRQWSDLRKASPSLWKSSASPTSRDFFLPWLISSAQWFLK